MLQGYGGGTGEDKRGSLSAANMTMIRRFNHHSTMVLKACEQAGSSSSHTQGRQWCWNIPFGACQLSLAYFHACFMLLY